MKIKFAAIVLVMLVFCCSCAKIPLIASSDTKIYTKKFVTPGMGIRLNYDSNWYVDDTSIQPRFEILYSYQAKAEVYLLNRNVDLDRITEEKFSQLLSENYVSDWEDHYAVNIEKARDYMTLKNNQMSWVQMTADSKMTYYGDSSVNTVSKFPNTVIWYFVNLKNGGTLFIKYEDYEEEDVTSAQLDEKFNEVVRSIRCISPPQLEYGYLIETLIKIDENQDLDSY